MDTRLDRLNILRDILTKEAANSQHKILKKLEDKGIKVTQATLSRDLRKINAVRSFDPSHGYVYSLNTDSDQYAVSGQEDGNNLMNAFLGIEFSANLAVIRTLPAFAGSIALTIDKAHVYGVMGTVAGDDNILLVLREGVKHADVKTALGMKLPEIKDKL